MQAVKHSQLGPFLHPGMHDLFLQPKTTDSTILYIKLELINYKRYTLN